MYVNTGLMDHLDQEMIYLNILFTSSPGEGLLDSSLGREVPPRPWNPDLVYDKKFVKIMENCCPFYDFRVKFHSFFVKMHDF